uniref:NADPH-dependent diflavin oxidoreductase 1 n=1 Tax=Romanomermis culicivorax TaxID=13658 RepID=A0A915ISR7_ROMCU
MKQDDLCLNIVFASQTGTAEDIAQRIYRQTKCRNFKSKCRSFDAFNFFDDSVIGNVSYFLFIVSTCGQGEMPDSLQATWKKLLRRNLPPSLLKNISFAVLGLGDSSYQKFNFAAKKFHRRLIQLGANSFQPLALADDQDEFGADSVTDKFIEEFWVFLKRAWLYPLDLSVVNTYIPSCCEICFSNDNTNVLTYTPVQSGWKTILILENERLTPADHFQDTRLIKLANSGFKYDPGDVVVVRPKNLRENVELFMQICPNIDYLTPFSLLAPTEQINSFLANFKPPFRANFKFYLENYFDLQAIPKKLFFEILTEFSEDEPERGKLQEFCSSKHLDDYISYCIRPKRTIVETMMDFPLTVNRVPMNFWFDLLPSIRPRSFSIASSPLQHKNQIHILLAVVKYKSSVLVKPRLGLCSNFLARRKMGDEIYVTIKKGSMDFGETDLEDRPPYIMIGPGTGVAPFRSFLNSRLASLTDEVHDIGAKSFCQDILIFGCRNKNADFYFECEYKKMTNIVHLLTAFSRDQKRKIYVQNTIRDNGKWIADLILTRKARIFIAGNAKQMPQDVKEAIKYCLAESGSLGDKSDLETYMVDLEKTNRLQTETWS